MKYIVPEKMGRKEINEMDKMVNAINNGGYLKADGIHYRISDDKTEVILTEESDYESETWLILKKLEQPMFVSGVLKEDASRVFAWCKANFLDLSLLGTGSVMNMRSMFEGCEAENLDLSGIDTGSVTDMSFMFNKCKAKSLDLSSFDTGKVTDMSFMFDMCEAKSLDLSSFNTSNVTDMWSMFESCEAESLDLCNFDTGNVTDLACMFLGCEAESIKLGKKCSEGLRSEVVNLLYLRKAFIESLI